MRTGCGEDSTAASPSSQESGIFGGVVKPPSGGIEVDLHRLIYNEKRTKFKIEYTKRQISSSYVSNTSDLKTFFGGKADNGPFKVSSYM